MQYTHVFPCDRPSPLSSLSPLLSLSLLDLIASDLISRQGTISSERDLVYRTLRAMTYCTYDARCLLLTFSSWSFVSWFVFKSLSSCSGNINVDSLWLSFPSSFSVCLKEVRKRVLRLFPLSKSTPIASHRARQRLNFVSLASRFRTFPRGLAERSTPLQWQDGR